MPRPAAASECRSCRTPIPPAEPILAKFDRCYYCGRYRPLGRNWTLTTVPVIAVAVIGLVALWWANLPS
jgi:hypothetical protein